MIFFILVIIFFVSTGLYNQRKISRKSFALSMSVLLLIVYLFKDNNCLPDILVYQSFYELSYNPYEYLGLTYDFEYGYYLLNKGLHVISNNFYFFIAVYSLIVVGANMIAIERYSCNIWLSVVLYLCSCYFSLFILRQYLAIAICIFSIPYIINRKFLPFFCLTLLATLFHRSAIIWIVAYLISGYKLSKKSLIAFFACVMLLSFFLDKGIEWLGQFIPKVATYTTLDKVQYTWKNAVISFFVLGFYMLTIRGRVELLTGHEKFFFLLYCIAFAMEIINLKGTTFSGFYRLLPYFSYAKIFLIPEGIQRISCIQNKILVSLVFIFLYGLLQYNSLLHGFKFLL